MDKKKHLQIKSKILKAKGAVIIITFFMLCVLLLLGVYFLTFTLTESKISKSQTIATRTYYLAEAGIYEAIWKLQNDIVWQNGFETEPGCQTWSASFSRSDPLFSNSSYQVTIQNYSCARGQVISTSTIDLPNGKTAQRIIKTEVFKTIGGPIEDIAIFSGGREKKDELKVKQSNVNVYNGNVYSSHNLKVEKKAHLTVTDDPLTEDKLEGQVLAVEDFHLKKQGAVTATGVCASNTCDGDCTENGCPPAAVSMPMVDFHSTASTSYENLAQAAEDAGQCNVIGKDSAGSIVVTSNKCVFSQKEFEDLLWDVGEGGTLVLDNDITYIKGSVRLKGGRTFVVNGVLVAEKNIEIGGKKEWKRKQEKHEGENQIFINHTEGKPSGLLSKKKIEFGRYASYQDTNFTGLLYALKEVKLKNVQDNLTIQGGIIGRKVKIENFKKNLNIYFDSSVINITLGDAMYSPVIDIEYWEESY